MSASPVLQGLLRGKLPNQKKTTSYFLEVSLKELRIYVGTEDGSESPRRHVRSLIMNDTDSIRERRSKWYHKKGFKFQLERADGRYIFKCKSEEERSRWMSSLQQLIEDHFNPHFEKEAPAPPLPPPLGASCTVTGTSEIIVEETSGYQESNWDSLVQNKWFWGYMNRGDCEKKLYNEGSMGDFVVRLNSKEQLVMSLWRQNGIQHHIIVYRGNSYTFQKATCGASGGNLIDMLDSYMEANNGSIHPFGKSLYIQDMNYSWKKKRLLVSLNPTLNSYNLVQLKLSPKGEKTFKIESIHTKPRSASPTNRKGATCYKDEDSRSTPSSPLIMPQPLQLSPSIMPQSEHGVVGSGRISERLNWPCNPQYMNVCDSKLPTQQIKHEKAENEGDLLSETSPGSEEYENWAAVVHHQKICVDSGGVDDESGLPDYVNWKQ